jgi:hypothetical protein
MGGGTLVETWRLSATEQRDRASEHRVQSSPATARRDGVLNSVDEMKLDCGWVSWREAT